jgi:hypothetical protein
VAASLRSSGTEVAQRGEGGGAFGGRSARPAGGGGERRRERLQFPRPGERHGGPADGGRGRFQQRAERGEIPGGAGVADAGRLDQCLERAGRDRFGEGAGEDLAEEARQLGGAAGGADQLDPRAAAVARQALAGQQAGEHLRGAGGFDGAEPELERGLAAGRVPSAVGDPRQPRRGELVEGQPERVVEVGIHRAPEHAQGDVGGGEGALAAEGAHGLEAHAGVRVGGEPGEGGQGAGNR